MPAQGSRHFPFLEFNWMGLKPQLFGSVMSMQAWPQHSPSKLSSRFAFRMTSVNNYVFQSQVLR